MAKCPNCGQKTSRTEDWACQHCGYPLLYGSYKKVAKKYPEIKAENRPAPPVREEPSQQITPQPPQTTYQHVTHYAPPPPPPVRATEPVIPPPLVEPVQQAVPPPVMPAPPLAQQPVPPQVMPITPVQAVQPPVQQTTPSPAAPPPAPVKPPELPPVLEPTTENLDIEKLFAILAQNYAAALEVYQDKILKVKGQVLRTVISDAIDINYLFLTGEKEPGQKQITCTFGKKREGEIARLRGGETVTVEGTMRIKYDGTRFNVLMKDCALYR